MEDTGPPKEILTVDKATEDKFLSYGLLEMIAGVPVICEFPVLREAWEGDQRGWITADRRVWLTNHDQLRLATVDDLERLREPVERCLRGLTLAMQAVCYVEPVDES